MDMLQECSFVLLLDMAFEHADVVVVMIRLMLVHTNVHLERKARQQVSLVGWFFLHRKVAPRRMTGNTKTNPTV
jgi:hypothetical protein